MPKKIKIPEITKITHINATRIFKSMLPAKLDTNCS